MRDVCRKPHLVPGHLLVGAGDRDLAAFDNDIVLGGLELMRDDLLDLGFDFFECLEDSGHAHRS